jgi:uncharacterized protein YoxC
MANGLGSGLLEIAMALVGIALIALLVGNSSKTVQVIQGASNSLDQLLRTVSLNGGSGVSNFGGNSSIY